MKRTAFASLFALALAAGAGGGGKAGAQGVAAEARRVVAGRGDRHLP